MFTNKYVSQVFEDFCKKNKGQEEYTVWYENLPTVKKAEVKTQEKKETFMENTTKWYNRWLKLPKIFRIFRNNLN